MVAKPADARPATAVPVVYGYGTLAKYKHNFSGVLGKVKDKTSKMMADAAKMAEQAQSRKGAKKLSLHELKSKAKAAFNYLKLDPDSSLIDYDAYKKGCQFLGMFLTEAQALKIFRTADLDGRGAIDFVNFQIALHINDLVEPATHITPLDAFEVFDDDHSGEIDQVEFFEVIRSMGLDMTEKKSIDLFKWADTNNSGGIDYGEFKRCWYTLCDVDKELTMRGMTPAKGWMSKKLNRKRLQLAVESHEKKERRNFEEAKRLALEARTEERRKKAARQAEKIGLRKAEQHKRKLEQAEADMATRAKEREQRAEERQRRKEEKALQRKLDREAKLRTQRHTEEARLRREQRLAEEEADRARRGDDRVDRSGRYPPRASSASAASAAPPRSPCCAAPAVGAAAAAARRRWALLRGPPTPTRVLARRRA